MDIESDTKDALAETAETSIEKAGDGFVQFVGEEATVTDVEVQHASVVEVAQMGMNEDHMAVAFGLNDGEKGYVVFEFSEEIVVAVIEQIMPTVPDSPLDSMGQSAMNDVTEGMMAGVVAAISSRTGDNLEHTPPENPDRPLRDTARQLDGDAAVATVRAEALDHEFNVHLVHEASTAEEQYG